MICHKFTYPFCKVKAGRLNIPDREYLPLYQRLNKNYLRPCIYSDHNNLLSTERSPQIDLKVEHQTKNSSQYQFKI